MFTLFFTGPVEKLDPYLDQLVNIRAAFVNSALQILYTQFHRRKGILDFVCHPTADAADGGEAGRDVQLRGHAFHHVIEIVSERGGGFARARILVPEQIQLAFHGGELARLGREFQDRLGVQKRVLVSRGLPAEYVRQWRLHEWVEQHYDLVLVPGEPSLLGDLVAEGMRAVRALDPAGREPVHANPSRRQLDREVADERLERAPELLALRRVLLAMEEDFRDVLGELGMLKQ